MERPNYGCADPAQTRKLHPKKPSASTAPSQRQQRQQQLSNIGLTGAASPKATTRLIASVRTRSTLPLPSTAVKNDLLMELVFANREDEIARTFLDHYDRLPAPSGISRSPR